MRVLERVADFLGFISDRQLGMEHELRAIRRENAEMSTSLKTILAALAMQGTQIDTLVAARDKAEQDDLDAVQAAIDANTAKFTAAVAPKAGQDGAGTGSGAQAATVTVASPTVAGTDAIVVSGDTSSVVQGAAAAGPGISATVTSVTTDTASGTTTLGLSTPTTVAHTGDGSETVTITPPAAS